MNAPTQHRRTVGSGGWTDVLPGLGLVIGAALLTLVAIASGGGFERFVIAIPVGAALGLVVGAAAQGMRGR